MRARSRVRSSTASPATCRDEPDLDEPPGARGRYRWLAWGIVAAVVILLVAVAVVIAIGSLLSYATVKARLDSFASDGDADLARADFQAIVVRLRITAAAAAVAALAVYAARRRLWRFLDRLACSAASALTGLRQGLTRGVALESGLHLGALALITVIGFLVRLAFLFQPMRYDESVTYVHYASRPWYIAVTNYTAPNNHVFHSLLVHFSTLVFGGEPWAIRLPALIAGVLVVPASYVAARALYGKHAALVGASLVASSSVLVEYSTNARGYTLVTLAFVLLLALATRLRTTSNPAEWLAFAVIATIGFYTVPVMLYAFGAVVVWLVLSLLGAQSGLLTRRLLPSVLVTCVLSALLYAPIVAASGLHSLVANEFVESRSWSTFARRLPHSLLSVVKMWHRDMPLLLAAALGAAFLVALVFSRRVSRYGVPPMLAAFVWIAPALIAQRVVPFERVWLFLLPIYLTTAAAGIVFVLCPLVASAGRKDALVIVLALALAGSLAGNAVATQAVYHSEDTSTFRDGAKVVAFLAARLGPGDKLLVAPPADAILEYWLDRRSLDSASLLYWAVPGVTRRFLVVVKEGPKDYPLAHLLADPRLGGTRLGTPRLIRRFKDSSLYELRRVTSPG